jgi:hypothetical protein
MADHEHTTVTTASVLIIMQVFFSCSQYEFCEGVQNLVRSIVRKAIGTAVAWEVNGNKGSLFILSTVSEVMLP